jgi:hypothetical protein
VFVAVDDDCLLLITGNRESSSRSPIGQQNDNLKVKKAALGPFA